MTWTPQAAQFVGGFNPPKPQAQPQEHTEKAGHPPIPGVKAPKLPGLGGEAAAGGEAAGGAAAGEGLLAGAARLAPLLLL